MSSHRIRRFRERKHDNSPNNQRREGKGVNLSSPGILSGDITTQSKRLMFLLHRVTSALDMEEILTESVIKLDGIRQKISQEYVEAVSYQHFIKTWSLISMDEIKWLLKITPVDYLLSFPEGVLRMAILTGELMEMCKLYTLKHSLAKAENACDALKVRGSEIPKINWQMSFQLKQK
ncbi:unnamed protein product [Nyctereutes procyonoides]|uniref:(raccoon dog) hypothetical protein n=1 Tax=Nyctereutes procyonoides TaxID=34880 RepID=A0A811YZW7_NYCPR|nr:unnamed protein product [Nyctereutes procyonoides]